LLMSWKGMAHHADSEIGSLVSGCTRWFTFTRGKDRDQELL
jgi:hypothetical protein